MEQTSAQCRLGRREGEQGTREKLLEQSQDDNVNPVITVVIYSTLPFGFVPKLPSMSGYQWQGEGGREP